MLLSSLNLLYIDPAATTALVSSITVIVAALGATFIILWRKFKRKVSKTLHLDENKNKEVEEDLVITDDSITTETSAETQAEEVKEEAQAVEEAPEAKANKKKKKKADDEEDY